MKNLSILISILISALLTGCVKEMITSSPEQLISDISGRPAGPTSPFIFEWQKCLGTSFDDIGYAVANASDGYFVVGYTTDINGNQDAMVTKYFLDGTKWEKTAGGSALDDATGVVSTPDGGCLVAGYTQSIDGDITTAKGGGDVLLIKFSASGNKEWVKTIGGSGYDRAFALIKTSDGGYALTGNTTSTDGDVSNSQVVNGKAIVWLVKFNITTGGPLIDWQKTIGVPGTRDDVGYGLVQAADGGYTIVGRTLSTNTSADILVINTDNFGVKKWDRIITSNGGDVGFGVTASVDNNNNITGYIVTGYLSTDLIVAKISLDGLTTIWQKTFSSGAVSNQIQGRSVISTPQGDIVVGLTDSKNGAIIASKGGQDLFVLLLDDANGSKLSSNVLGGKNIDVGQAVIKAVDGGYIAVGKTYSNNGDVLGNHGGSDAWLVKFKFQ